jgi:hypothetical protein
MVIQREFSRAHEGLIKGRVSTGSCVSGRLNEETRGIRVWANRRDVAETRKGGSGWMKEGGTNLTRRNEYRFSRRSGFSIGRECAKVGGASSMKIDVKLGRSFVVLSETWLTFAGRKPPPLSD